MSIYSPPKNWFRAPSGNERVWIGLSLIWCIIMFLMMPYWHFKGKQNSTGESYSVKPSDFNERVERFVASNKVKDDHIKVASISGEESLMNIPLVEPAPGGHAYLIGRGWKWYPALKLKKGQEYKLHISSLDFQHGFSMVPLNINFQILPGYDHVLTITPTQVGEYKIICNEYCGPGHHTMTGKIIVE